MINRICKWLIFKILYPVCYYAGALRKVKNNKVIFVENHSERLSDNYILLYEQLEQKEYDLTVHYLSVSSSGWGSIVLRTLRLIMDMSTAACVFINESNSVFGAFHVRKGTKLVQLWHACGAFKKWGYSVADKSFGDNKKELDTYSPHRNYNLVSVSGKEVVWAYEEAFGLPKTSNIVKPLGVSRTDVYFDKSSKKQAMQRLKEAGIDLNGKQIIAYVPTFRGDIKAASYPNALNNELLYKSLQKDYIFLIKNHPFIKEQVDIPKEYADFMMDISDVLSIEDVLLTADILITDYSSIVFEYSLMQRPMLFFAYDLKDYYDERGFYYPYEDFVPGPVLRTTEELIDYIKQIGQFDFEKLKQFRELYMDGCDGRSTERILANIFEQSFHN